MNLEAAAGATRRDGQQTDGVTYAGSRLAGLRTGGVTGWILGRLDARRKPQPRLAVLERIALAPRQSLLLVEAEGRRFLVAIAPEGAPAIFPLDERTEAQSTVAPSPCAACGSSTW